MQTPGTPAASNINHHPAASVAPVAVPATAPAQPPLRFGSPAQGLHFDPSHNRPDQYKRVATLISYPKSGRTWLRFMLNCYLCQAHGLETDNVFDAETKLAHELWIQNTHLLSAMVFKRPFWETGPIAIANTQGFRSVWLTRNIRDTLRSAYYQATQRVNVFEGTPSEFLFDARFGAIKIASFYAQVFAIQAQFPGLQVIRYEDCRTNPAEGLAGYLMALGIEPDQDVLAYAVEQGERENMKQLSLTEAYAKTPLAPKDRNDPSSFKVRTNHQELFTEEELAYIDQVTRSVFPPSQQPLFSNLLGDSKDFEG